MSLDQLNWYDLFPADRVPRLISHLSQALLPTDTLTGEHFALLHSAWRAERYDTRFNHRVYRFDVVLDGPSAVLDRVERVTYLLPPAWPTSPAVTTDRSRAFGWKDLAWANLLVRARVDIKNQAAPIPLSAFVRLTDTGEHLVTK